MRRVGRGIDKPAEKEGTVRDLVDQMKIASLLRERKKRRRRRKGEIRSREERKKEKKKKISS